ncbi:hypothetical protein VHUM_03167 [Vanrija humicola]|uniref:Uncharacterized protein n=1 Tax=Vanrija humicola TaxID=5417 RepID=A0A7D8Z4E9_VANHU|nr:hypothetical protein VHUM_03167 [Vanrija humicola]
MQLFIKTLLAEKRTGSIVNVASVAGLRAFPGLGTYGLSKAAIAQLTRTAATEYGPSGIRVNAIAPGATHTAMTKGTVDQRDAPLLAHTSLKRWAEPKEMASSIVYLAVSRQVGRANPVQVRRGFVCYRSRPRQRRRAGYKLDYAGVCAMWRGLGSCSDSGAFAHEAADRLSGVA